MHCNIHQADRALNAVQRESFWQQKQRLRLNGGAEPRGKQARGSRSREEGGTGPGSAGEGTERERLQVCRDTDSARVWPSREDCEGEEGHLLPLQPCSPDHLPLASTAATTDSSQGG